MRVIRSPFAAPYRQLARFTGNLATCLEAGIRIDYGLEMSDGALVRTRYRGAADRAAESVRGGAEMSRALADAHAAWPPFFVPVLKAGEESGQLEESLRYLECHCKLLDGPARAIQKAWAVPVSVLFAGVLVKTVLYLQFVSFNAALSYLLLSLRGYAALGLLAFVFLALPRKPFVDHLKLALPVVGAVERELAINRFFNTLSMLYVTGGNRVETMIRFAARSVSNFTMHRDLLMVATEIERGASLGDAFALAGQLTPDEKDTIAAGDLAGKLDTAFTRISNAAGDSLVYRLRVLEQLSARVTTAAVMFSIAYLLIEFA